MRGYPWIPYLALLDIPVKIGTRKDASFWASDICGHATVVSDGPLTYLPACLPYGSGEVMQGGGVVGEICNNIAVVCHSTTA